MAIAPVVIEFLAKGMPQVNQAFKSVQDAAIRSERAQSNAAADGERKRVAGAKREAQAKINEEKRVTREAERAERQRLAIRDRSALMAGRFAAKQAADEKRAQDKVTSDLERAEQKRLQIRERSATMAGRFAAKQAAEERKAREREAREHERDVRTNGRIASSIVGAGARGVVAGLGRSMNMGMGLATTVAQLGGGFTVSGVLERQLGAQRAAANIATSTLGENVTSKDVLNASKATGARYGIDTEEVAHGIGAFKDLTGSTLRGMALAPEIAKLATAFGGDLTELNQNAGNIAMSAPDMSNDDVMRLLRVQTAQGAVGAVEGKDMARYGGRLVSGASLFGGDRAENIASMGAIAQVARQHGGAASPAEAVMAAQRFATDVQKHASDLEAKGIKVSDGHGGLRNMKEIMGAMLEKSGGDVTKLTQFGLGERGIRALTGFSDIYRSAGGGDAGKKAVADEWKKYTTGVSDAEVTARAAKRMGEPDKQLEQAFVKLRQAAGEQLLPEFLKMVEPMKALIPSLVDAAKVGLPAFVTAMQTIADFVKTHEGLIQNLAAHPIGTMIGLEITKAGLPTLLPALFRMAFNGLVRTPPIPPLGAGGGVGGPSPVGGGLAAGVATGAVIYNAGTKYGDGAMAAEDMAAKVRAWGRGDLERGLSPAAASKQIEEAKNRLANTGAFEQAGNILASPISDSASASYTQYKHDQALVDSEALQAALLEVAAATRENSRAVGARAPNNSGANGAGRYEPINNR